MNVKVQELKQHVHEELNITKRELKQHFHDELHSSKSEVIELFTKQFNEITESLQTPHISSTCLYDLGCEDFELLVPIFIRLEEWEDEIIASWPELNLFTSADTGM